jgi:hypothetical protein
MYICGLEALVYYCELLKTVHGAFLRVIFPCDAGMVRTMQRSGLSGMYAGFSISAVAIGAYKVRKMEDMLQLQQLETRCRLLLI